MIIVADLVCWGSEHVPFNTGALQTVLAAFPEEDVLFVAEPSHSAHVREQLGSNASRVRWKELRIPRRNAGYLERLWLERPLLKEIANVSADHPIRQLLILAGHRSTVVLRQIYRKLLPTGIPVQLVLHGGLTGIGQRRSLRPLRRLRDWKSTINLFGRRGIQYLVLEENIRQLMLKELPFLAGRVEVFEHPLLPNETASEPTLLNYPIRFGFLGLANRQKGFPIFLDAANRAIRKYSPRVEFHALGMASKALEDLPHQETLTRRPAAQHLSRDEYTAAIAKLHFTIFPYDPVYYASCPSGTLLDAVSSGKPLIAARIPMFENFFLKHGNVGYLFGSNCELNDIIDSIVTRPDPELYKRQVRNVQKASSSRTSEALAINYRLITQTAKQFPEYSQSEEQPPVPVTDRKTGAARRVSGTHQ
ncbi:MAG TPA: hypothetical protein VNO43_15705 [Candidatus Eisenbacteria bacterium]|nr:hypothetical protein [Candidatus Eisenbacteria bacterium]